MRLKILEAYSREHLSKNRDRLIQELRGDPRWRAIRFHQFKAAYFAALLVEFISMHFINRFDVKAPYTDDPRVADAALREYLRLIPLVLNEKDSRYSYSLKIERKKKKRGT